MGVAAAALEAAEGQTPTRDVAGRDAAGQFTARYNRARRRMPGAQLAAHLRTAEEKAEGRVRSWPRFVHEQPQTIDAKLRMLGFSWMPVPRSR